jgi:serine/threonine-protein kinase RsbW
MIVAGSLDIRSYPAISASVPEARSAVAELAEVAGASEEQRDAVRIAVSEALTNVVVHAYQGGPGMIHVSAAVAADELWVLVADDGCGLHPREDSPGLGVGLALIAEASDGFAVVKRSSGGTEVRMRFVLEAALSPDDDYGRGSSVSAVRPASSVFSTTS